MNKSGAGFLRRGTRVIADTVIGYALVAVGIVLLVTPGPGLLVVVAGVALLARHYHFAERLKRSGLDRITQAGTRLKARRGERRSARRDPSDTAPGSGVGEDVEAA